MQRCEGDASRGLYAAIAVPVISHHLTDPSVENLMSPVSSAEVTARPEVTEAVRECALAQSSVWCRGFLALPLAVCPWYKTLATGRWSLLTQEERDSCKPMR